MKKGLSHIDWAISMGIFLVYILSMFIFIKPSLQQENKQEDLLPILLKGFDQDTKYIINKIPLYIDYTGNTKTIARITFTENNKFPFSANDENLALIDKYSNYIPFTANLNNQLGSVKLEYDYGLRKDKRYVFWLLYSQDINYQDFIPSVNDESVPEEEIAKNGEDFTYKFGISEEIKGISENKLDDLPSYEILKQQWKFPDGEEFSLQIYNSSSFQYNPENLILSYNPNIIAQQTNVYTREFKDFILESNTELKPLVINFRFGSFLIENG